jgi:hypothetical protein
VETNLIGYREHPHPSTQLSKLIHRVERLTASIDLDISYGVPWLRSKTDLGEPKDFSLCWPD